MLSLIVNGLPISIDCATEGHLVDTFLPENELEIDIEAVLCAEESEIQFDDVLVIELSEPLEQYLS